MRFHFLRNPEYMIQVSPSSVIDRDTGKIIPFYLPDSCDTIPGPNTWHVSKIGALKHFRATGLATATVLRRDCPVRLILSQSLLRNRTPNFSNKDNPYEAGVSVLLSYPFFLEDCSKLFGAITATKD